MTQDEKKAYMAGYIAACTQIAQTHNQPTMAAELLRSAGLTDDEVKALQLSDFDLGEYAEMQAANPSFFSKSN
ncbi:hypothetical protein [Pseudovibrio sp. WM33]|uniref:hypothetical protein n=1 Tax=Pseudovibrio sp. WM33 TaxID=1735585 RepID=UPI0007AEE360|nr:hypothetical protein [Pseudovibrio sp. WM33]KZL27034.1 hypothetical protein PsWM33_01118 [Pseudovibrio sp. WM33]